MTMRMDEERFETDLRAALAPEPASTALRQRVLAQATEVNRTPRRSSSGWLAALDPRSWRVLELGGLAAAASLAIGVFAGANGLVPDTTVAMADSADSSAVDLVALAYDASGIVGDLQ